MTHSLDADNTPELVRSMKDSIREFNQRVLICPPENGGGPDGVAERVHGAKEPPAEAHPPSVPVPH